MTISLLILFYSIAIIAASLLGGWLPSVLKLGHTRTQVLMSFVAGLMLGVAFYHLLPHAIVKLSGEASVDHAIWWLMIGLLFMFVLLRIFRFHQHGPAEESEMGHAHKQQHSHSHSNTHAHAHENSNEKQSHSLSWLGVAFGLALHTLIDGVALGASVQADSFEGAPAGLLGLGVFIAIVLHKPLDAMSISTLMKAGGWSLKARTWVNLIFAMMCPLGAYLFLVGAEQFGESHNIVLGSALAFSAGVFICISLSDLLPEIQFHSHDRGKLTFALLLGVVTAYGIGFIEPGAAHDDTNTHAEYRH